MYLHLKLRLHIFSIFLLASGENIRNTPWLQKQKHTHISSLPGSAWKCFECFNGPKGSKIQPPSAGITWQTELPGLPGNKKTMKQTIFLNPPYVKKKHIGDKITIILRIPFIRDSWWRRTKPPTGTLPAKIMVYWEMPPCNSSYLSNIQPFSLEPWLWGKNQDPETKKNMLPKYYVASVPQVQGAVPPCSPHQGLCVFGFFDLGWMVWIHKPRKKPGSLTFHWILAVLIGILVMAYSNHHITG